MATPLPRFTAGSLGATNNNPGAVLAAAWLTHAPGAARPGSLRYEGSAGVQVVAGRGEPDEAVGPDRARTMAFGPAPLSGGSPSGGCGAMRATVKEKLSPPAPAIATAVCTVTRSPAANGARGFQIVYPAGSVTRLPGCTPLREPVTRTGSSAAGVTPRKLIVVCGRANRSPGAGETVTVLAVKVAASATLAVNGMAPASAAVTATAALATPA